MHAADGDGRRTLLEYTDSIACDIHKTWNSHLISRWQQQMALAKRYLCIDSFACNVF